MTDQPKMQDAEIQLASLGRLVPFLDHLQARRGARSEWRRLEKQWLTLLLTRPVIPFTDAQLAAELIARHQWEDARRMEKGDSPRSREALDRLRVLRVRRTGIAKATSRAR